MQQGNFIDVFLARHVSGTYAHHQAHLMLSCCIWFSAPSFWMSGGLESRCVGRVSHGTIRTAHTTFAATLNTTTHRKTRCRKPYAATQTSNAPDDGRMYPKHAELRIHQQNYLVASSWHFTLLHEEDTRSNNPQGYQSNVQF